MTILWQDVAFNHSTCSKICNKKYIYVICVVFNAGTQQLVFFFVCMFLENKLILQNFYCSGTQHIKWPLNFHTNFEATMFFIVFIYNLHLKIYCNICFYGFTCLFLNPILCLHFIYFLYCINYSYTWIT